MQAGRPAVCRWMGTTMCGVMAVAATGASAQMQTPGTFAVNERGAATYTLPIAVPPGVGGVQPRLELVYNSQRGNGPLGVGWALSGLSAITRCPQTLAQDGMRGAVNYDANDRFCLDSQRLQVVEKTYGVKTARYRTEIESYSSVIQAGPGVDGDPVGPGVFVVTTKDGLSMAYGGSDDSRLQAQGKTVNATWLLSSVIDAHGNRMNISYLKDIANGVGYPLRIDYASNSLTGLPAAHTVHFDYEVRPDIASSFHAGSKAGRVGLRLARIRTVTEAGKRPVLEYRLGYGTSTSTGRSRIESIAVCTAAGDCLPASTFTWETVSTALRTTAEAAAPEANQTGVRFHSGDYDGDGKTDLLLRLPNSNGSVWATTPVMFSNGDGTWRVVHAPVPTGLNGQINDSLQGVTTTVVEGDVNGDARQDLIVRRVIPTVHPDTGEVLSYGVHLRTLISRGDGTFTSVLQALGHTASLAAGQWHAGDYDGDGRTDLLVRTPDGRTSTVRVLLSKGDGTWNDLTITPPAGTAGFINGEFVQAKVGDFDGDGKHDVVLIHSDWASTPIFFSAGNGNWRVTNAATPSWAHGRGFFLGDYNGDGKTDLFIAPSGTATTGGVLFAKGDGTWDAVTLPASGDATALLRQTGTGVTIGDFNGDSRHDLLLNNKAWTTTPVLFSRGDGTFALVNDASPAWANNFGIRIIGDYNGDGAADFAHDLPGGSSIMPVLFGAAANGERITRIRRGGDRSETTDIVYGTPAASAAHYKRTRNAVLPQQTIAPTFPIVVQVLQDDGKNGSNRLRYFYDSAMAEAGTGRGFLGFREVTVWDESLDTATVSNYRLDWPLTGRLVTTSHYAHWNTRSAEHPQPLQLSSVAHLYACQNPATAPVTVAPGTGPALSTCSVTAGARYQTWTFLTLESQTDLNGAPLPRRRTDVLDMDRFGNPGRVIVTTLNPDGSASGHVTQTDTWYSNDETRAVWSHPVRRTVTVTTP
jgi:hypothetical protein